MRSDLCFDIVKSFTILAVSFKNPHNFSLLNIF
jgi:hypothetical protein